MRPIWNDIWMRFAFLIAERSIDPKLRVGAVIITTDNTQVLSLGYNGDHKGGPNQRSSNDPGNSGFIHAEINALIKLDFNNPKNKIMYVTHSPCPVCAKAIINAGINKVVYSLEFREQEGIDLLRDAGIEVEKYPAE